MKKTAQFIVFLLFISISFTIENTSDGILFSYNKKAESVFLVGSMNGWDENGIPMENNNGVWEITITLSPGKHTYKFIVDGNWEYDESNPAFEDDGYGGINSMIEIDSNGMIKSSTIEANRTVSPFNKKIDFNGRYFSNNIFSKNETERFMLNTPEHDLNLGINIEFNSNFTGYTVLNINNTKEATDLWKTHFNYKRTYLRFEADYINVIGFDNFGMFSFDNPLDILGGIGYNNYKFGYDYSGAYIETSDKVSVHLPISFKGQFIFADKIGFDEDDVTAMRISLSLPRFNNNIISIGKSDYQYRTKLINENIIQNHRNQEFDLVYEKDFQQSNWKNSMKVKFFAEYSEYENSNEYFDQDSLESWMDGQNIFLGSHIKFPTSLKIYLSYLQSSLELSETEIDFKRNRIVFGLDFKIKNLNWNFNAQFWENNFHNDFSWSNYYEHVAKTDANGRWFQEYSELSFEKYTVLGYENGVLWESDLIYKGRFLNHNLEANIRNKFAHQELFSNPKFVESVVVFEYEISSKWKLKTDTRIPYYNDSFLDIKTDFSNDQDIFISNYSEISYYLSDDVWLSFGYGVNPKVINPITDQFYNKGREDYLNYAGQLPEHLESYYVGLGDKIRNAEQSLADEKSISIQAVMEF